MTPRKFDTDPESTDRTAVTAARLARQATPTESIAEGAITLVRTIDGFSIIDTRTLEFPDRLVATRSTVHPPSWEQLVTDLRSDESVVRAYGDATPTRPSLVAILNDDTAGGGDWRDHRVEFHPQRSPEFEAWLNNAGLGTQERFANHIDARVGDIVSPSAADMLTIAQTFTATTITQFGKAVKLRDGSQQVQFEEQIDAAAGRPAGTGGGAVAIPEHITVTVAPFEYTNPITFEAKLRFTSRNGELKIGYILPDDLNRQVQTELEAMYVRMTDVANVPLVFAAAPPVVRDGNEPGHPARIQVIHSA